MEKFCISVDWLQTYCLGEPIEDGLVRNSRGYTFVSKLEAHQTQMFTHIVTIEWKKQIVATIQQKPRTSTLNAKATTVKLSNRVLYCDKYIEILYAIQEAFQLHYKGITRLDICYDCNFLHGQRSVPRFLRQFICGEAGVKGHIIRSGSARFSVHGTRTATQDAPTFNSVRLGSPASNIGAYVYDKTLEMLEEKHKPWIEEFWHKNGLTFEVERQGIDGLSKKEKKMKYEQYGFTEYVAKRVWRFEISIKAQGMDILNMQTAEIFRLSPRYLEHEQNIRKLFYIYAAKVFDFRVCTKDGQRIRYYEKMKIFEDSPIISSKPFTISKSADTGRMEKICYNKLGKLMDEYTDLSEPRRKSLMSAMQFLQELSGVKMDIARKKLEYQYLLSAMNGNKFMNEHDVEYFALLEMCAESKRDVCPEVIYDIAFTDERDIPLPDIHDYPEYFFDTTPPEYTW